MYADLNIPWPTSHLIYLFKSQQQSNSQSRKGKSKSTTSQNETTKETLDIWKGIDVEEKIKLKERVQCAIRLGYSIIAFNLIIPQNFDPILLQSHFPFNSHEPPFPDLDPRTSTNVIKNGYGNTILQLSRLTMVMDESVAAGGKGVFGFSTSQTSYLSKYSLLSAMPLDAGSFSHACLSLSPPTASGIDIITLDISSAPKLPFQMSLSTVSKALENNVGFEICYSSTTSSKPLKTTYSAYNFPCASNSAPNHSNHHPVLRNFAAGAKDLIRVTNRGKGLIFSSGASNWSELRSADDIANFGNVLGLSQDSARRTLTSNPKSIVSKAISTRQTHKGVISNPVVITITPKETESNDKDSLVDESSSLKRVDPPSPSTLPTKSNQELNDQSQTDRPNKKRKKKIEAKMN
ncbi:RNase P subunit p30-domain-containing protein [Melampsora americana]|nr:RNase P subunit p30-domain-containing protein [Melampsora americana]